MADTSAESKEAASSAPSTETAISKSTDWSGVVKRVRDTNEWIVKAFVGLGALLLGTTPLLAHLNHLKLDDRGVIAAIGILVSLIGAAAIAWLASNVNLTEITEVNQLAAPDSIANDKVKRESLNSLKSRIEGSRATRWLYLFGESSIDKLLEARRRNIAALRSQTASLYRLSPTKMDPPNAEVENPAWKEVEGYIKQSRDNVAAYDRQLTWLADWASFETITARFKVNRRWMAVLGFVTFLGLCTWVLALGADLSDKEDSGGGGTSDVSSLGAGLLTWAKPTPPTGTAEAVLPTENQIAAQSLRSQLQTGNHNMATSACDAVGVLLEGGSGTPESPWQVSVLPRDPCPVKVRFTVDRRLATLAAFKPTDNPKTAVTIKRDALSLGLWLNIAAGVVLAASAFGGGLLLGRRTSS
jgi:hypothetical protein